MCVTLLLCLESRHIGAAFCSSWAGRMMRSLFSHSSPPFDKLKMYSCRAFFIALLKIAVDKGGFSQLASQVDLATLQSNVI